MNGHRHSVLAGWCLRWILGCALVVGLGVPVALAGPGMPDPKQMSGIPRPDAQIEAGQVTVRVLDGSFDKPVLGTTVQLELRTADGKVAELRKAETVNQGRAFFRDLGAFIGGQAVAHVMLDGTSIRSRQIDLLAEAGTAVMLVKGAPKPRGPTQEVSLPGIVFDFPKAGPGALMVGVFDLTEAKGLPGVEVKLDVFGADGSVSETRTITTAKLGQATFEGLSDLPEGTIVQAWAQLDDGEPYRTMKFAPVTDRGQAIVLARGRMASAGTSPHQDTGVGQAPRRPAPLPTPKIATELPLGTVQVMVVDGTGKPLADQEVTIVKKDFAGTETRYTALTGKTGVAVKADLPVVNDALFYAGVKYDGAPYTSPFFGLDKRGGVKLAMRVWEVTNDASTIRSAVQFEVIEGENDMAQVIQLYQVMVSGDKAYWPDEPLEITGLEGSKGFVVLRGAEEWLDHEDKARFATLSHPIPPGELAPLSVGYVIEHAGTIQFDWTPPFEVVESVVIISDQLTLEASGAKQADRPVPEQPGLDYKRVAWILGAKGTGDIQATVSDLRRTNPMFRTIATWVGGALGMLLLIGLIVRPGGGTRQRLLERREQLLSALSTCEEPARRRRLLTALDRVYRQAEALRSAGQKVSGARPG